MHIQVSYGLHQVCVDGVTYLVTEILHHLWNQFPEDVQEHISYVALNYEFHLMELREKQRERRRSFAWPSCSLNPGRRRRRRWKRRRRRLLSLGFLFFLFLSLSLYYSEWLNEWSFFCYCWFCDSSICLCSVSLCSTVLIINDNL